MLINFDSKEKNNKTIKSEIELLGKDCMNIENEDEAIKKAIELACNDFMARTEAVNKKVEFTLLELLVSQNSESNSLIIILREFFSKQYNSQNDFDDWHYNTCNGILARIRQKYPNAAYGKAQKILNMTFKYLYCTKYGQNKINHFKYCHMALDSYILEWVFRDVYTWYNEGKKHPDKLYISKTPSWSKLDAPKQFESSQEKDDNEKYYYTTIAKRIFEYFENKEISPFEAEFIIWHEIQLHIAAENFISAFKPDLKEKKGIKEKTLDDKLETIINIINER